MGSNAGNLTRDGKMEADCISEGQLHWVVLIMYLFFVEEVSTRGGGGLSLIRA